MLSIVIPCYNEEQNIPLIILSLIECIGQRTDIEIVLVNNGSKDNTSEVLKKEIDNSNKHFFKIITVKENQGYGFGILSGLGAASGTVLSWTHADMQTDPLDVIKAYELYNNSVINTEEKKLFIKGKRKNRKLLEAFFTFGMQIIAWIQLKCYLSDINAQPKMFSKEFFELYLKEQAPHDFSLDLYALYIAKKYNYIIKTIPVYFAKRQYGEAKGGGGSFKNKIKLIKRTLDYISKLKKNLRN